MSLTRIGSIGINTGIAFAGVTTIVTLNTANDALSIGATVNVGSGITLGASGDIFATGVSTFSGNLKVGSGVTISPDGDIFATGVSTFSGNLKVGSGVTISPDGDGFYTGVVTATTFSGSLAASNLTGALPAISGANLTNLDASDLASGTVPTARLGSGTASSSTFLRGDSTFQTVNTDLVSDTSPQLGGALDTNGNNIDFATNDKAIFGDNDQLKIYYDGSNSVVTASTNGDLNLISTYDDVLVQAADNIFIRPQAGEEGIKVMGDGAVELYYDNSKVFETGSDHISVQGSGSDAGGVAYIKFKSGNGSHRANIGKTSGANGKLSVMNLDNDSVEFGTSGTVLLELQNAGHLIPSANGSYNLGGTSNRWANVYTNDLNLSNEGKTNDVDGTWGDYTIQEGESDLFLINNRNGKKYKFNLTEVS